MGTRESPRTPRLGITLVEVVVGLALLGGLLVMMLIAAGRLEKQRKIAEEKLEAVAALDRVISSFFSIGFPPTPSDGPVPGNDRWAWKLANVNTPSMEACTVVRISIVDTRQTTDDAHQKGLETIALAAVEVLVANSAFSQRNVMRQSP